MKKCLLTIMLLLLVAFSSLIRPSQEMEKYSYSPINETTISVLDTNEEAEAITESSTTINQKWQTPFILPPKIHVQTFSDFQQSPFRFINGAVYPSDMNGFISVVQHHSNYLS